MTHQATAANTSPSDRSPCGDRFTWPLLKGKKDYLVWRQKIMAICRERKLIDVLLNDRTQDVNKTRECEQCFSMILLSLNEDTGIHATEFEDSATKCHQLWTKLQGIYGDKDPQTSAMILQTLSNIKKKQNQTLDQHLKRFDELISQYSASTSKPIENVYKNTFLLTSLSDSPEYKQTITALMTATIEITYETIVQKLKITEEQISREKKETKNQAFNVQEANQDQQKESRQCYKCHKFGHIAINCRSNINTANIQQNRGSSHHVRGRGGFYRGRGGNNRGYYHAANFRGRGFNPGATRGTSFQPRRHRARGSGAAPSFYNPSIPGFTENHQLNDNCYPNYYNNYQNNYPTNQSQITDPQQFMDSMYTPIDTSDKLEFVLDSGSSAHIVNNNKFFREY